MSSEIIKVAIRQENGYPCNGIIGGVELTVSGLIRGGGLVSAHVAYYPGECHVPGGYVKNRGLSQGQETAVVSNPALLKIPEVVEKL
jgi:hypothetical protein